MLPPEDEVSIEIEDDYLDELDDLEVEDEAIA
jgi:hypothetical protein